MSDIAELSNDDLSLSGSSPTLEIGPVSIHVTSSHEFTFPSDMSEFDGSTGTYEYCQLELPAYAVIQEIVVKKVSRYEAPSGANTGSLLWIANLTVPPATTTPTSAGWEDSYYSIASSDWANPTDYSADVRGWNIGGKLGVMGHSHSLILPKSRGIVESVPGFPLRVYLKVSSSGAATDGTAGTIKVYVLYHSWSVGYGDS